MYPTKEEILDYIEKVKPDRVMIAIVKEWKDNHYIRMWSGFTKEQKQKRIEFLIRDLWLWLGEEGTNPPHIKWGSEWAYSPDENIIYGQEDNPSILSALHEVGHALLGPSELHACGFSIGLFSTCFPNEYSRLEWNGHMLQKPITN